MKMEKTTTKTKTMLSEVSSPILSELVKIVLMAISNPLYFSYFIFFSPYIFKLFSFLSPLFVTTTLLVLALVTTATTTTKLSLTTSKVNADDCFEDSEVYKLVFDTASSLEAKQQPEDVVVVIKETCSEDEPVLDKCLIVQERSLVRSEKVVAKVSDERSCFGSPAGWDDDLDSAVSSKSSPSSRVDDIDIDGGDYSTSMRKQNKEWRRTLACKLFEERHNGAGEGMDLLWETYESEQSNDKSQTVKNDNKSNKNDNIINKMRRNSTKRSSSGSSVISSSKGIIMNNNYSDDDDDDDYEDETNGQLCCLQALKFSAGKMSLGMGKPSLVKFSKAFKGFGWLQNVARHGKKRYNNNTNNRD